MGDSKGFPFFQRKKVFDKKMNTSHDICKPRDASVWRHHSWEYHERATGFVAPTVSDSGNWHGTCL